MAQAQVDCVSNWLLIPSRTHALEFASLRDSHRLLICRNGRTGAVISTDRLTPQEVQQRGLAAFHIPIQIGEGPNANNPNISVQVENLVSTSWLVDANGQWRWDSWLFMSTYDRAKQQIVSTIIDAVEKQPARLYGVCEIRSKKTRVLCLAKVNKANWWVVPFEVTSNGMVFDFARLCSVHPDGPDWELQDPINLKCYADQLDIFLENLWGSQ